MSVLKKVFGVVVAISFLLGIGVTTASFAADLKLGVMNVQRIIMESDAGKEAKERFDTRMKELQATFKKEEGDLKGLQDEIKKKSSAWSEEKKAEKVREFQKNGRELKAKTDDARYEMKQLQDKELEPILKTLEKVVDAFGQENKYTIILDAKNGVIFAADSVDITTQIVDRLNKAMGSK